MGFLPQASWKEPFTPNFLRSHRMGIHSFSQVLSLFLEAGEEVLPAAGDGDQGGSLDPTVNRMAHPNKAGAPERRDPSRELG